MKTILLTINHAVNVRDILRTAVFRMLRESGHRIVLLTPAADDPEFVKEFAGDTVIVERLVRQKPGRAERTLDTWRMKLFPELGHTMRILSMPRGRRAPHKRLARAAALGAKRVVGARRFARGLLAVLATAFPDRRHRELLDRHAPDVVVLTELFGFAPDWWIWKEAHRRGLPVVWLARSWDNLTTKGVLPVVDKLVVWSEEMRREAIAFHGYDGDDVHVAGTPYFDLLVDEQAMPTREAFFRRIGADPGKTLITYALAPLSRADAEFELAVIERLCTIAREGGFGAPCQILARTYPLRGSGAHERLRALPGLLVDIPGRESRVFTDRELRPDDIRHAAATLRYSGVVVNVASTFALEAAVCGTPAVCTAFDFGGKHYLDSHLRYFDFDHYRKLLATGGVRAARSMDDLVAIIRAYVADRRLDADRRRAVAETLSHRVDGHAGERVAKFVLQYVGEAGRAR